MGRAYVLQAASKWEEAATFFERVVELLPDDLNEGLRAKEENAWCQCQLQHLEVGIAILQDIVNALKDHDERDEDTARCLWRLGKCYWGMGGMFLILRFRSVLICIHRIQARGSLSVLYFIPQG